MAIHGLTFLDDWSFDCTTHLLLLMVQKALISVDESGTEAAATAVVMELTSAMPEEPVEVTVDRPFVFLVRDIETGAILFVGRVVDPS